MYEDARRAFREHIATLNDADLNGKGKRVPAGELMELYLEWVEKNRSTRRRDFFFAPHPATFSASARCKGQVSASTGSPRR